LADAGDNSDQGVPTRRRPTLWQVVTICVGVAILSAILYYSSATAREIAFKDERAFRVLDEVATQIRNLENSRATLLRSMPTILAQVAPLCTDDGSGEPRASQDFPEWAAKILYSIYLARLDLPDARLCSSPTEKAGDVSAPSRLAKVVIATCAHSGGEVALSVSIPDNRLISILCQDKERIVAQESLEKATAQFVSQDFFDEALLALSDGTVVGEFPVHDPASRDNAVKLHSVIADRLNILNAKALFEPADASTVASASAIGSTATAGSATSQTSLPSNASRRGPTQGLQPVAFDTKIGDESYHIYVLPFRQAYRLQLAENIDEAETNKAPNYLYVVGVHRITVADEIIHALWPFGLWVITLLIGLNLVAWPLLSLAFGPAEESISARKAVACALGVLVLPAILTVAAMSLWSMFELESWIRVKANAYAQELTRQLQRDIHDGAKILTSFRKAYKPFVPVQPYTERCQRDFRAELSKVFPSCDSAIADAHGPLIGFHEEGGPRFACLPGEDSKHGSSCSVRLGGQSAPHWSQIRNILALDINGKQFGPVFTVFKSGQVKPGLDASDREYFQALKHGQARIAEDAEDPIAFVAQRLFNRGDASKALQIAVPLCDSSQASDASNFCGLITGDLRMHSLIAAIDPPLLKFAVIDTSTGTVLFHSNDRRGLAENFFRESGRDPSLLAAINSERTEEFSGRYLGDPHHFFYVPVKDVPWGVIVFYSDKELGDLPFRAGTAALATYGGLFLGVMIVLLFARWLVQLFRPDFPSLLDLAKRLWPRLPLRDWHRDISRLRPSLWAVYILLVATLFGLPSVTAISLALVAMVVAALSGRIFRPSSERKSQRTAAQQHTECVAILLTAISVVPAYGLFGVFHRLQLDALIRDGLVQAAFQTQKRYDLIQQDLRRWIPPNGQEWVKGARQFPDPWRLVLEPDMGMSDSNQAVPSDLSIKSTCPDTEDSALGPQTTNLAGPSDFSSKSKCLDPEDKALGPEDINMLEHLVWLATVGSADQRRRIALLDEQKKQHVPRTDIRCGVDKRTSMESCVVRMADGTYMTLQTPAAQSGLLIQQDREWTAGRVLGIVAALIGVALGTSCIASLLTKRLFGLSACYASRQDTDPTACPYNTKNFKQEWKKLARPERLVLYQIASGHLANPRNEVVVDRLFAEGLIHLAPWPALRWPELEQLILRSETAREFAQWQKDAAKGVWKTIRVPLFIFLMVLIAWLSWAAGGSMKAISAILLAAVALLSQLTQLFNFARTGVPPPTKGAG